MPETRARREAGLRLGGAWSRFRRGGLRGDRVMESGRLVASGGRRHATGDVGGGGGKPNPFWITLLFFSRGDRAVRDRGGELLRCLLRAALARAELPAAHLDHGTQ